MQLHLRVVEARGLPKMDIIGKSDPYCLIQISGTRRIERTRVINNNNDPVWNQEFHFPVSNPQQTLCILVKDQDTISADDPISRLDLSLATLYPGQVSDQWFDLIPVKGVKKGGSIHLVLHLAQAGQQPFVPMQGGYPQQMNRGPPPMYQQGPPQQYSRPPQYAPPPQPMYQAPPPQYVPAPQQPVYMPPPVPQPAPTPVYAQSPMLGAMPTPPGMAPAVPPPLTGGIIGGLPTPPGMAPAAPPPTTSPYASPYASPYLPY